MKKIIAIALFACYCPMWLYCQEEDRKTENDTLSKFDKFNIKAETAFQYLPVPLYSYSTDAGHIFGLAKFNLIKLSKDDTISQASKISEVFTYSTEGRINFSVSTDLIWDSDKFWVKGYINFKKQPEYILGIGNDVSIDDVEQISFTRFKWVNYGFYQFVDNLYTGIGFDISNYTDISLDSNSFLIRDSITGIQANTNFGLGISLAWDSRDNRYNPGKGSFLLISYMFFPKFLNNSFIYSGFNLDARKYFNPWHKHIIALQATTSFREGNTPFYDLAMLGGENKMRGYYLGALRDNVLVDAQLEYRMPIWNIFGAVAWVGTGRVAKTYSDLSLNGLWLSYGFGLRLRVDSEHNTNLRFDWGFGPGGISSFYINFAEAF